MRKELETSQDVNIFLHFNISWTNEKSHQNQNIIWENLTNFKNIFHRKKWVSELPDGFKIFKVPKIKLSYCTLVRMRYINTHTQHWSH